MVQTQTIPCYYINLDRSPERDTAFKEQCRALGIVPTRVAAIDARAIPETEVLRLSALKSGQLGLGPGEMACYLSHRKVWEIIRDGGSEWAFVAEDDARFADDMADFLKSDDWLPTGADIVKAETARQVVWLSPELTSNCFDHEIRILNSYHGGTAGYFVSRQSVARLLEFTNSVCDPLDHVLFHEWIGVVQKLSVYQIDPALCIQDYLIGAKSRQRGFLSTLDSDRTASRAIPKVSVRPKGLALIWREFSRPFKRITRRLKYMAINLRGTAIVKKIPIKGY